MTSRFHRLAVWVKLPTLLFLLPTGVFLGAVYTNALAAVVLVAVTLTMGVDIRKLLHQLSRPLSAVALGLLVLHLAFDTAPMADRLHGWVLDTARFSQTMIAGTMFVVSTSPLEILQTLARTRIHPLGIALVVAHRTVPLLTDRVHAIFMAQEARGARWGWKPSALRRLPRLAGAIFVPAVYSSLEIALAFHDTLTVRGYRPGQPIARPPGRTYSLPASLLVLLAALAVAVIGAMEARASS